MIPGRHSSGYQNIGIKGESMSIIMDEKSAHTMSSVIYSDHRRKEALIRELCTNATDAHIMAGKESVPIEVTLPTVEYPYLLVKDQGIGISKENGVKYFTSFFASESQREEKPTGYYGLGAKSPHAYTDAYEVIMIKDGLKSIMLCFKDEEGIPSYRLLKEDALTEEPNGVSFKVPVMEKDFDGFLKAAHYVLPMFATRPRVFGDTAKAQGAFIDMEKHKEERIDLNGIKILVSKKDESPSALRLHPSHGTLSILMGNILYPVDIKTYHKHGLINKNSYLRQLHQALSTPELAMVLDIDIARYGMRVEPGRERIITNAKNMAIMESIAERVVKTLYADAKRENEGKVAWQISKEVLLGEGFMSLLKKDPVTYLKYQFLGAGERVTNSQLNPLLSVHDVKATVVRSDATLSKTNSMSSSRFISSKHGEFSPRVIDRIVVLDDRRLKIGEISEHLLKMHFLEEGAPTRLGVSRPLGVIVRANSKNGTPKEFADAMFGEGEYMMASDLVSRDIDTTQLDEMNEKSVRLVQYSKHYHKWHYNEDFALSQMELKRLGTRAIPRKRINVDTYLIMTEEEFQERKDEMSFLFRHGRRHAPNILISKKPIEGYGVFSSLDDYVKAIYGKRSFADTFTSIVAKHEVTKLLVIALKEMSVNVKDNREFGFIHEAIVSIMQDESTLASVLPHIENQTRRLFLSTRNYNLRMHSTDSIVNNAKNHLRKHDLLTEEEEYKALEICTDEHQSGIIAVKDIITLLQKKPLEMQHLFCLSTDLMRALENSILQEGDFSNQQIIERLKRCLSHNHKQKVA